MRLFHCAFVLFSLVWCSRARAGLLGTNVASQYYVYGSTYDLEGSPASFIANGTVQESFCATGCPEGFTLTVSDTKIVYTFLGTGGYWSSSGPALNSGGLYIDNGNLLTFSGVNITGVTLDGASNVPGFSSSNITFNASNIAANWAGLTGITPGEKVILDVVTATPASAPEPTTYGLLVTGLAGTAVCLRRRRLKGLGAERHKRPSA